MSTKIMIVDDHPMIRAGLRAVLAKQPDLDVVAEAGTGKEAVQKASKHKLDVILMDVEMPDMDGCDATREIRKKHPDTKVVVLSIHAEEEMIKAMFAAGASAYLLKDSGSEEIINTIRVAAGGKRCLGTSATGVFIDRIVQEFGNEDESLSRLSAKERSVLKQIAEEMKNKEIANNLKMSEKSVEKYRHDIMNKLDIHTATGLVKFAVRTGLTRL
jgi:DNA-binding NarL/FixJ family response regulator